MNVRCVTNVQVETAPKLQPFAIKRLIQPYLPPDNAVLATQRITDDLALMFHHQLTHPGREKWPEYDRVVVPVPKKPGRYRLYGRGFCKDEGTEISWTPAQEQEMARALGYGNLPPWNDMPTSLPRILYPPGHFTEEHLRKSREEEREKQKQEDEARASVATAVDAAFRAGQSTNRPATKPRPRGVKVTVLCKKQKQKAKETANKDLGEKKACQGFDGDSERKSESSEEYTPTEDVSDGEWEEHGGGKKSRVIRSRTEKQEEVKKLKARSAPTAADPALPDLPEQPNLPLVLDDGSCIKCKTSTGGAMVSCDNENTDNVWCHIQCAGLDQAPGENDSWFCDDCQKRDTKPEQLGGSGGRQAKRCKGRNLAHVAATPIGTQRPKISVENRG